MLCCTVGTRIYYTQQSELRVVVLTLQAYAVHPVSAVASLVRQEQIRILCTLVGHLLPAHTGNGFKRNTSSPGALRHMCEKYTTGGR
eukprot:8707126-Pyramimonas_sp.AAC.3